jgi:hypothetical protein
MVTAEVRDQELSLPHQHRARRIIEEEFSQLSSVGSEELYATMEMPLRDCQRSVGKNRNGFGQIQLTFFKAALADLRKKLPVRADPLNSVIAMIRYPGHRCIFSRCTE